MAPVISDEQKELNKLLHRDNKNFGNRADGAGTAANLATAIDRMNELGVCKSVLDYGTGKGKLVKHLRSNVRSHIRVSGYDPAVEEWDDSPSAADIVTCLDVLEHIEYDSIDALLNDIKRLTNIFCYLVIDLQPAVKVLADGRNAHILLAPPDWWVTKIAQIFPCHAAFPIYHERGKIQKIVIAACSKNEYVPFMYGFLNKMRLFDFVMAGGPLGKKKKG